MNPRHVYRVHKGARTSFIWAPSFPEAQASYGSTDDAEWVDVGEVGPTVLDADGWPVSIFDKEAP